MRNRLLSTSMLLSLHQEHIRKTEAIWNTLEQDLVKKYVVEGYWQLWAEVKASNDVLELRSKAKNPSSIRIPTEFTTQGDLD